VDVAVALLFREGLAVLARLVEVASVLDDLAAEATDRPNLHRIGALRDADHRAHAEQAPGEGDRLAVVPRRGGDDAALSLVFGEL
jgi:hypothetical protein